MNAQQDTVIQAAKRSWFETFDGPCLTMDVDFGARMIQNFHRRSFEITSRNAHFISVLGRILLGEESVQEPENYVKRTLSNAITDLDNKIAGARAIMVDAGITKIAAYEIKQTYSVKVVSPIAKDFLELLKKSEEFLVFMNTLWLHGAIDDRQRSKHELELKRKLRSVVASARNMFIVMRKKLNAVDKEGSAKAEKEIGASIVDDAGGLEDVAELGDKLPSGEGAGKPRTKKPAKASAPKGDDSVIAGEPTAESPAIESAAA